MGRFKHRRILLAESSALGAADAGVELPAGAVHKISNAAIELSAWASRGRPNRKPWDTGKMSANFRVLRWTRGLDPSSVFFLETYVTISDVGPRVHDIFKELLQK